MMSGNPFPQNAWLTYAEATARGGKPTSPKQVEYILATPEALSAHPAVQALIREAEARGRDVGICDAIEAMQHKVDMWAEDAEMADWAKPGKTLIAEAAAIRKGGTP